MFVKRTVIALAILCGCAADPDASMLSQPSAAFELMSTAPDVAAPLWVRSPIVLSFSAPLDVASVSAGVRLDAAGGPVDFTHQVDGALLSLQITTPPPSPATLTLTISESLRDQTGRPAPATTRSWQLPLWRTHSADGASARAPKLAHARGATWLAWEGDAFIQLAEHTEQGLCNVEALPVEAGALLSDLVIDADGSPVIAWRAAAAHVARYSASGWQALDVGLDAAIAADQALGPRLAVTDQGALLVAWPTDTGVELFSWSLAGPWQRVAPATTAAARGVDLAWSASGAVLALLVDVDRAGNRDLQVQRFEAGAWRVLTDALEYDRNNDVPELAVEVGSDGAPLVAWTEVSDGLSRLYVSRFSDAAGSFQKLGAALNVGLESDAVGLSLDASAVVGFQEVSAGEAASYVARWQGSGFVVLGGSLGGRAGPAIALDQRAQPLAAVARADTGGIELHQYNESPVQPYGLSERKPQPCTLPLDSDPTFPKLLSQTACYTDLATQSAAAGWIPYDLNSPLWSDGAFKRRFFSIPDNTTIGFTASDAWELPVGTMLAKEFLAAARPRRSGESLHRRDAPHDQALRAG